jgi:hypothetical protein
MDRRDAPGHACGEASQVRAGKDRGIAALQHELMAALRCQRIAAQVDRQPIETVRKGRPQR